MKKKGAIVPLYFFRHLGLIVVNCCCQVTVFCYVSSLPGSMEEEKKNLITLTCHWLWNVGLENKIFVRCICTVCAKEKREKRSSKQDWLLEKLQQVCCRSRLCTWRQTERQRNASPSRMCVCYSQNNSLSFVLRAFVCELCRKRKEQNRQVKRPQGWGCLFCVRSTAEWELGSAALLCSLCLPYRRRNLK